MQGAEKAAYGRNFTRAARIITSAAIEVEPGGAEIQARNKAGKTFVARTDAAVGLARVVHTLNWNHDTLRRKMRKQIGLLGGARSHDRMRHWMQRQQARAYAKYGFGHTVMSSAIMSGERLRAGNARVVSLGGVKPIELFPVLSRVSAAMNRQGGNYSIIINDDFPAGPKNAMMIGVGKGDPETGSWTQFRKTARQAVGAYYDGRDQALSTQEAYMAAARTIDAQLVPEQVVQA